MHLIQSIIDKNPMIAIAEHPDENHEEHKQNGKAMAKKKKKKLKRKL